MNQIKKVAFNSTQLVGPEASQSIDNFNPFFSQPRNYKNAHI